MGDHPLAVDPVVLRERRQVSDDFPFFRHGDPAVQLVCQRMVPVPAVEVGVVAHVVDFGEIRVGEDAQLRDLIFQFRALDELYGRLHRRDPDPGDRAPCLALCDAWRKEPLTP